MNPFSVGERVQVTLRVGYNRPRDRIVERTVLKVVDDNCITVSDLCGCCERDINIHQAKVISLKESKYGHVH